jgi:hypothetical protein
MGAIGVLSKRLAVPPGACDIATRAVGYKDAAERFAKARRLGVLQDQLKVKQNQLAVLRPVVVASTATGGYRWWVKSQTVVVYLQ